MLVLASRSKRARRPHCARFQLHYTSSRTLHYSPPHSVQTFIIQNLTILRRRLIIIKIRGIYNIGFGFYIIFKILTWRSKLSDIIATHSVSQLVTKEAEQKYETYVEHQEHHKR